MLDSDFDYPKTQMERIRLSWRMSAKCDEKKCANVTHRYGSFCCDQFGPYFGKKKGKFWLLNELGEFFGKQKAIDWKGKEFMLKMGIYEEIQREIVVMRAAQSNNLSQFARLIDSGENRFMPKGMKHFVVMDFLGESLHSATIKTHLDDTMYLAIAEQCLRGIKQLHGLGFVHRGVKPKNFVLGRDQDFNGTIYIIDFEGSRPIGKMDGTIVEAKSVKGYVQASRCCSIVRHLPTREFKPIDDIESWFYTFYTLVNGELPWARLKVRNAKEMCEAKIALRTNTYISEGRLSRLMNDLMELIDTWKLKPYNLPHYGKLYEMLHEGLQT